MGMIVWFAAVTPQELDRACEEPEFLAEIARGDQSGGYLDKAWDRLQYLFNDADLPVSLTQDGFIIDTEATGWDVDTVQHTAQVFKTTPFEILAGYYWGTPDATLDYLRDYYQVLVRFFTAAAAAGSAAIMFGPA